MSRTYETLGSVPANEECAQVGTDFYDVLSRIECDAYKHQLERVFGDQIRDGTYFGIKSFSHDFGRYHEVCFLFDDDDDSMNESFYLVDSSLPVDWDDISIKEMIGRFDAHKERLSVVGDVDSLNLFNSVISSYVDNWKERASLQPASM